MNEAKQIIHLQGAGKKHQLDISTLKVGDTITLNSGNKWTLKNKKISGKKVNLKFDNPKGERYDVNTSLNEATFKKGNKVTITGKMNKDFGPGPFKVTGKTTKDGYVPIEDNHGNDGQIHKNQLSLVNEGYKLHYPSLKKMVQLQYTDPRIATEGKNILVTKEGNFRKGDENISGHYIVYEDKGMPGTYIGVHISSDMNEDTGEPSAINVVALDTNRSTVTNRMTYRMRQSKIVEAEVVEEITEVQHMQHLAGILTEEK